MDLNKLTQPELAALLDISERRLQQLFLDKENPLPAEGWGKGRTYVWAQVFPWWIDKKIRQAGHTAKKRQERAGVAPIEDSEARKAAAEAEMAELKLAERRGDLLTVTAYEQAHALRIKREKEGMAAIESRLLTRLGPEQAKIVGEEIRRALGSMDQIQLKEGA